MDKDLVLLQFPGGFWSDPVGHAIGMRFGVYDNGNDPREALVLRSDLEAEAALTGWEKYLPVADADTEPVESTDAAD